MKAFCSWSGGKDSMMALHRAVKDNDIPVTHCLNMITEDGKYSRSHGIRTEILKAQADAMGFSIIQKATTWDNYEEKFKEAVTELKEQGIQLGIFGDIDLQAHRDWVERVCGEMGIKAMLPLWLADRETLMNEFIQNDFQAVVTATVAEKMGREWLGRPIDQQFINDLKRRDDIDLCGENGEYHTLVTDGPLFEKRIEVLETEPQLVDKHWFLNISKFKIAD